MTTDKHGRNAWLKEALEKFEGPLIGYAMKITGDRESAQDAVQETFLKLLDQPRSKVEDRLAPWLFTVCRNRALDTLRKGKRMKSVEQQSILSAEPAPFHKTEQEEETHHVMTLVGHLPKNQQEVLRLKFQSGLSYREISEVLGLTVSNVGVLIHTALKTLRQQVK
ncbi:MAG: sigma-70 family RNA polymerase sigma factor [Planctomycetota bacterium]|nr:sigma-70 family RNA polymerase sigma factor [Planctomycetota bacterium]